MKRFFAMLGMLLFLAGCGAAVAEDVTSLPTGDAERGASLFQISVGGSPTCTTCHSLDGSALVGPSLQGFSTVASSRVEGQSAEAYTMESILYPSRHIVEGFANVMYANYSVTLDEQQLADLIAFLLTQ